MRTKFLRGGSSLISLLLRWILVTGVKLRGGLLSATGITHFPKAHPSLNVRTKAHNSTRGVQHAKAGRLFLHCGHELQHYGTWWTQQKLRNRAAVTLAH